MKFRCCACCLRDDEMNYSEYCYKKNRKYHMVECMPADKVSTPIYGYFSWKAIMQRSVGVSSLDSWKISALLSSVAGRSACY